MMIKIFISQWVAEPDTMTLSNTEKNSTYNLCLCVCVCVWVCVCQSAFMRTIDGVFFNTVLSVCTQ